MAQDAFGDIIILGGLAVGGYFLWQWWSSQTAPATTTPATTTPAAPAAPPAYQYTPPAASQQLIASAATNTIVEAQGGQADAYQWATIYNGISGLPSIASVNINATFFPSGLPNQSANANKPGYSQNGLPLMTAQVFIQGITSAGVTGLSGLGQARLVPVPVMFTPGKRSTISLPAGTTPAQLQAKLRAYQRSA